MSILIEKDTPILIVGITGKQGRIHTTRTLESGAKLVAGVAPGKAGEEVEGIPVYNTVTDARKDYPDVEAAMIIVPSKYVKEAAINAIHGGIKLLVIITEFVPVKDSMEIMFEASKFETRVIGPNTIGIISPGKSKLGIMPDYIYGKGHIGIASRSGTLTHETASNLTFKGYGLSTCVGIGGDPIIGSNHSDIIELFAKDDETDAIIVIGEIGGTSEEDAAEKIKSLGLKKPVFAYIAGMSAPSGKKMGHAGAIVSGGKGTVKSKVHALKEAGVIVCETLGRVVEEVEKYNNSTNGRLKSIDEKTDY